MDPNPTLASDIVRRDRVLRRPDDRLPGGWDLFDEALLEQWYGARRQWFLVSVVLGGAVQIFVANCVSVKKVGIKAFQSMFQFRSIFLGSAIIKPYSHLGQYSGHCALTFSTCSSDTRTLKSMTTSASLLLELTGVSFGKECVPWNENHIVYSRIPGQATSS